MDHLVEAGKRAVPLEKHAEKEAVSPSVLPGVPGDGGKSLKKTKMVPPENTCRWKRRFRTFIFLKESFLGLL